MSYLLLLSAYLARPVLAQYPASDCTSFTNNGIAASTFQYYRFYDFRNLSPTTATYSNASSSSISSARGKVVKNGSWTEDWYIRDYPRNSPGGTSIPVNFTNEYVSISPSSLPPSLLSRTLPSISMLRNTDLSYFNSKFHRRLKILLNLPNPLHHPLHPARPTRRRNNIHRTQHLPRLHPRLLPRPRFSRRNSRNIHLQKRHPRIRY